MAPRDIVTTARPASLDDVHTLLERAAALGGYTASPADWRDEVLYFLLPDRFSDGREDSRDLLTQTRSAALRTTRRRVPTSTGAVGRLRRALAGRHDQRHPRPPRLPAGAWVSRRSGSGPIFKQRARLDTFHGYGVQDFLEVDPRFGTRADLVDLCEDAHARGLRIILDIIANHTGDNWGYVPPGAGLGAAQRAAIPGVPAVLRRDDGPGEGWSTPARRAPARYGYGPRAHDGVFPLDFRVGVHPRPARRPRRRRHPTSTPSTSGRTSLR